MSCCDLLRYINDVASTEAATTGERRVTIAQVTGHLGITSDVLRHCVRVLANDGLTIRESADAKSLVFGDMPRPLDISRLRKQLADFQVTVLERVPSTNSYVVDHFKSMSARPCELSPWLVIAENQEAGRGTRGRQWTSAGWRNVCMTVMATTGDTPGALAAISLAVGVVVAEVLSETCQVETMLKWPNDVLVDDCKLVGVLVETVPVAPGLTGVVIGLGINIDLGGQPVGLRHGAGAIDLKSLGVQVEREQLVSRLAQRLASLAGDYSDRGFAGWHARWQQRDTLAGRDVTIDGAGDTVIGRVIGVDTDGCLRLKTSGGEQRIVSGTVSRWRRD